MLERFLQVKESKNYKIPLLMFEEWTIIEKLIGVLVPFEELTKELSAADVSIPMMMLLIAILKKNLCNPDAADEYIGLFGNFVI